MNDAEAAIVGRFLSKLRDESDRDRSLARMLRESPRTWAQEPEDLLRRLAALEAGLAGRQP